MNPRLVVDERERQSQVPEELSNLGIRVYFSKLEVADYVVSPEIAVERKTVNDLVSSIYDSRLFYQAERISASFTKPYLVIEGDYSQLSSLVKNEKSYFGAIASISLNFNLRIIHTLDPRQTAVLLYELLKLSASKKIVGSYEKPLKGKETSKQQLYLISAIPGIGLKLAERLLLKYGTPRKIFSLTTGELAMIPGIGWKRAEKIVRLLDTVYGQQFSQQGQMSLEI